MEKRQVHRAFELKGMTIAIDRLLPTKQLPPDVQKSSKYKVMEVSIREIGIIEPIVVVHKKGAPGYYLLLDGHVRVHILMNQGHTKVFCLLLDSSPMVWIFRTHYFVTDTKCRENEFFEGLIIMTFLSVVFPYYVCCIMCDPTFCST